MDTPIAASGKPGAASTVLSGIYLASDPDATVTSSGIAVFWAGLRHGTVGTPEGIFEATHPLKGGAWSSGLLYSTGSPEVDEASTVSAGTGGDGHAWVSVTGTDTLAVGHAGHLLAFIPPTQCCVYQPGIASGGSTGATYVAYRGHGRPGVYAVYGVGYPFWTALDISRIGAAKPAKLATFGSGPSLEEATITAGPNGRLWATWFTNDGGFSYKIHVRASGPAGQSFGPAANVSLPSSTSYLWKVYTSAQAGREDALALISTKNGKIAYYATQVLLPVATGQLAYCR